jgi:hypothetical protein
MKQQFPRTEVAGVSLSRMIIGTNWLAGWSHTSVAADEYIKETHSAPASVSRVLEAYMEYGIDTIMGAFDSTPVILQAVKETEQKLGKPLIIVDTPIVNMDDTDEARKEAEQKIKRSKEMGATFCLIHHAAIEQLLDRNRNCIHRIDDYTKMIRDAGLIPGLSAHMPEVVVYCDRHDYDVETYIQLYNCMGFLMQTEIENVASIIHNAKKPVMTIKPMAAGRCSPYVGLSFAWATLRDCDMVTVGAFSEREVHEDVEISFAAIERRFPGMQKRQSPNMNQAVFG